MTGERCVRGALHTGAGIWGAAKSLLNTDLRHRDVCKDNIGQLDTADFFVTSLTRCLSGYLAHEVVGLE